MASSRLVCVLALSKPQGQVVYLTFAASPTHSTSAHSLTNAFSNIIFQKKKIFMIWLDLLVLELARSNWTFLSSLSHSYTFFSAFPPPSIFLTWSIPSQAHPFPSPYLINLYHATTLHPEKMDYKEKNLFLISPYLFCPTIPHKQVRFIGVARKDHKWYMIYLYYDILWKLLLLCTPLVPAPTVYTA